MTETEELRQIVRRQAAAIESLTNIVDCAESMRKKQKEYFRTRDAQVLREAKHKALELDVLITAYRNP